MAVPILLIAGFLGAGKTTLLKRLLSEPGGRRIAAVVNDFGAIDIDVELLGEVADDVVSLKNGCICCTLQGDLLRTLAAVLRRPSPPDLIVIETSGISDPAEIVRSLLDPVIFKAAALDTVLTLVDAAHVAERSSLFDDTLWQSQLRAADFVILNKVDLIDEATRHKVRDRLTRWKSTRAIFEAVRGDIPHDLLLSAGEYVATSPARHPQTIIAPRFEAMNWTSPNPLTMPAFQALVTQLAQKVLRAKGIVTFEERPGQRMEFQLVGTRATVVPCGVARIDSPAVKLVVIYDANDADCADIIKIFNPPQDR